MSTTLESREVLVVDCQSTGANPRHGHLLEIAWAVTSAGCVVDDDSIRSSLVSLPDGASIPRRITAITGIDEDQLEEARPPDEIWTDLLSDAGAIVDSLTVAHFAQFEAPFLVDLHDRFGSGPFPLLFVCTREIARRVFPQLPRFGLRALAGHLGHGLEEARRAAEHVRATARVWQELCRVLVERGVHDSAGLKELLDTPPPKRDAAERSFPLPVERRRTLPDHPGVYRFVDPGGRVLYVGKAASLQKRVATYFQPRGYRLGSTLEMLTQAFDVKITETETRLEAALLEVDEIKRLDPPYNTALRDRGNHRHSAAELFDSLVSAIESPMSLVGNESVPLEIGLTFPEPPDFETLRAGVGLFCDVFLDSSEVSPERLSALGAVLWWEREGEDAGDEEDQSEDEEIGEREPFRWTPQRVARSLARGARTAAHLQRKEIWHRLICTSTITWQRREEDEGDRVLVIEDGAVPDSLRVLTTEIRRLVTDERLVEIQLAPDVRLTPERARRLLEWI